jgi:hypothetical protein
MIFVHVKTAGREDIALGLGCTTTTPATFNERLMDERECLRRHDHINGTPLRVVIF